MRNTDKLREYAANAPMTSMSEMARAIVRHYCDAIDVEASGDGGDLRRFAERLEAAASERADVTLFDVDYTALPLDAEGEAIHVGDWITGMWDAKAKVVAVTSNDVYWWEPDGCHWCHSDEVRHHHAPTVEDVLREFAAKLCIRDGFIDATEETFAEYAAKLRLAGDVE